MERTTWTDERLTDAVDRLQHEMHEMRADLREMRQTMMYGFIALSVGQLGIVATIVATA
jgi:hypothetical protein